MQIYSSTNKQEAMEALKAENKKDLNLSFNTMEEPVHLVPISLVYKPSIGVGMSLISYFIRPLLDK